MTDQEKQQLLGSLHQLVGLIEHDAVVGFVLVAIHPTEAGTIVSKFPGKRFVDRLLQELEKISFKLKAIAYLGAEGQPPKEEQH